MRFTEISSIAFRGTTLLDDTYIYVQITNYLYFIKTMFLKDCHLF